MHSTIIHMACCLAIFGRESMTHPVATLPWLCGNSARRVVVLLLFWSPWVGRKGYMAIATCVV